MRWNLYSKNIEMNQNILGKEKWLRWKLNQMEYKQQKLIESFYLEMWNKTHKSLSHSNKKNKSRTQGGSTTIRKRKE